MSFRRNEHSYLSKRNSSNKQYIDMVYSSLRPMPSTSRSSNNVTRPTINLNIDPSIKYMLLSATKSTTTNTNIRHEATILPSIHRLSSNISLFRKGSDIIKRKGSTDHLKPTNNNTTTSLIGYKNLFKNVYKKNEEIDKVIKKIKHESLNKTDQELLDYHVHIVRCL
jgi:hypothetical protein